MMKTYKAKVEGNGLIRLDEPGNLPPNATVFVSIIEDEDAIGGIPVTMLLSEKALSDWNSPEEDEAWKHLQRDKS